MIRDYIDAYCKGLWVSLYLTVCTMPVVGVAFIALWVRRAYYGTPGDGWLFHTPISDQWMWILGIALIAAFVLAQEEGVPRRAKVVEQELLLLGALGLSTVVSVVSWRTFWIAAAVCAAFVVPVTLLEPNARKIREARRTRIAEQEHALDRDLKEDAP